MISALAVDQDQDAAPDLGGVYAASVVWCSTPPAESLMCLLDLQPDPLCYSDGGLRKRTQMSVVLQPA